MRQKILIANWKMNGGTDSIRALLAEITSSMPKDSTTNCVILPPAVYLPFVQNYLSSTNLKWGAQNVYPKNNGPFTGELSAPMLQDFKCSYVLVGHSERRHLFHEDEKFVADKFHHVKDHDMIPLLCIGETLEQRDSGLTEQILAQQLQAVVEQKKDAFDNCIIAYEPVWAIGTGLSANPEQVQATHQLIRELIRKYSSTDAEKISILYGGSVTPTNAKALFAMSEVDGGLIGGASLNAQQFVEIFKCTN